MRKKSTVKGREKLYAEMILVHGERCGICGNPPPNPGGLYGELKIDHCHKTGIVRGLLCNGCNSGLGALGDDEEGLLRALAYVRAGQKSNVVYYTIPANRMLRDAPECSVLQGDQGASPGDTSQPPGATELSFGDLRS